MLPSQFLSRGRIPQNARRSLPRSQIGFGGRPPQGEPQKAGVSSTASQHYRAWAGGGVVAAGAGEWREALGVRIIPGAATGVLTECPRATSVP